MNRSTMKIKGRMHVDVAEAARRLGIIPSRVYLLIRSGEFKAATPKDSRRAYIRAAAVLAYKRRRDAWLRQHGRTLPQPLAHAS